MNFLDNPICSKRKCKEERTMRRGKGGRERERERERESARTYSRAVVKSGTFDKLEGKNECAYIRHRLARRRNVLED